VEDVVARGGGVLRVGADVEVQASAVGQEDVAAAPPGHDPAEQVAGHLVGAEAALAAERAGDPVLVLEPEDPALHGCNLSPSAADGADPGAVALSRPRRGPSGRAARPARGCAR